MPRRDSVVLEGIAALLAKPLKSRPGIPTASFFKAFEAMAAFPRVKRKTPAFRRTLLGYECLLLSRAGVSNQTPAAARMRDCSCCMSILRSVLAAVDISSAYADASRDSRTTTRPLRSHGLLCLSSSACTRAPGISISCF